MKAHTVVRYQLRIGRTGPRGVLSPQEGMSNQSPVSFYNLTFSQVANKKQRDTAASDAEMLKRQQSEGNKENKSKGLVGVIADMLGEQEDADVIF